jgi:phage terminase large subunit-like protein
VESLSQLDPTLLLDPRVLAAERGRRARRRIDTYFPDSGALRRELYVKHLEFFRAGRLHRERLFMAGNRVGKSDTGCYEDVLHLTGAYPVWWEGRRFETPIEAWVAGETNATTRDILQLKLLGRWGEFGTGLIPADAIVDHSSKRGLPDAVDSLYLKHASGGVSMLGFKAYSEGRGNFQGTAKHLIHFDEEPSMEVYAEALMRTMIVPGTDLGGLMLVTFTPLLGWTDVVTAYLAENESLGA